MFDITTNQVIKIHKGDSSGVFPLYLNAGTAYAPFQYKFYPALSVCDAPEHLDIDINSDKLMSMCLDDGLYDFEYNFEYDNSGHKIGPKGWYLNSKLVNPADYGIEISGSPLTRDHLTLAKFTENPSEVYLYIVNINDDLDQWLVKKTFTTLGEVYTEFNNNCNCGCKLSTVEHDRATIDPDHNLLLSIDPEDTQYLKAGEYCYQIKAQLYDIQTGEYYMNTVTSRLPFYIVDGADSMVW